MNPRQKMSTACILLWTILSFVVSSSGRPSEVNGGGPLDPPSPPMLAQSPSAVVPQIGVLEERADISNVGKDTVPVIIASPSLSGSSLGQSDGTAEKGILVPIVAVHDADSSKNTNDNLNNPLVALLPAPVTSEAQNPAAKPEIRRSLSSGYDDSDASDETMDVAEDIVFRPLFRIRQANGKSSYPVRNLERNRPNYRRYNVNGYYRLPYNYFQSNY